MTENTKRDLLERPIPDQEVRDKIVQDLDKTILVEAGAGSGKTKSLVDRMLALLREGKCAVETLAAVTFTRKAAAELRGRFQTELEESIQKEKEGEIRNRLVDALQNLEQCYIGTIHSFCARILRERPIEIALDPEFEELEDIEDIIFREKSWFDYLIKVRIEDEAMLQKLDDVGISPEDLKDAFKEICTFPEVTLAGGRSDAPDYGRYRYQLEAFLENARKIVPLERPEKGFDELMNLMRRCFRRQRIFKFDDHLDLMETFDILDKGKVDFKVTYWPDKDEGKAFKADFDRFQEEVIRPGLKEWREYRHSVVLDFLRPAVQFYAARRKSESLVNFEDLLMMTSRLLRDNPEVRQYFGRKFTHILVDEFQDTDPIQAEVMMYLTGTDVDEGDWRKLSPRLGSLFVVGDPKQSIFRFRRADIDIYNLVKEQIVRAGGEVLTLTANFRSMDSLRDWVNPVFERVFPEVFTRYQAGYAPLHTLRPEVQKTISGIYKIVAPRVKRHTQIPIAEYDAAMIGDYIKWACEGNVKVARSRREQAMGLEPEVSPGDFMILFRYKKNMQVYARALEKRGIPFEITGGKAFEESEEIREIVNLAQALVDPENPIYTVAVLRGIFFGASDNELLNFKRKGGRFSYLQRFELEGAAENKDVIAPGAGDLNGLRDGADEDRDAGMRVKADSDAVNNKDSIKLEDKITDELEDSIKNKDVVKFGTATENSDSAVHEEEDDDDGSDENKTEFTDDRIVIALKTMRKWWQWTIEYPATTALEKIFEESGIINYLASAEMGNSKAGNVFRLLEILRDREMEGETSFAELVDFLRDLTTEYDVEEMSLMPGRADAVRLMNLHKAKGLEAPVVFLANPVGLAPHLHIPVRHIMRTDEVSPLGYFLCRRKWGRQWKTLSQPEGWDEKFLDEKMYRDAEERRLMYVAATRARNILVVSSYEHNLGDKRAWGILDDALGDVPELEIPMKAEVAPREKLVVDEAELTAARTGIEKKVTAGNRPGYRVETVTALAKEGIATEGQALPERVRGGLGMSWGRVVHSVLNILGKEIDKEISKKISKELDAGAGKKLNDNGIPNKNLPIDDPLSAEDKAVILKNVLSASDINLIIENALAVEDIDLREKGRGIGIRRRSSCHSIRCDRPGF